MHAPDGPRSPVPAGARYAPRSFEGALSRASLWFRHPRARKVATEQLLSTLPIPCRPALLAGLEPRPLRRLRVVQQLEWPLPLSGQVNSPRFAGAEVAV